jgi:hypothetical protein
MQVVGYSSITIEEYNYLREGFYDTRTISKSSSMALPGRVNADHAGPQGPSILLHSGLADAEEPLVSHHPRMTDIPITVVESSTSPPDWSILTWGVVGGLAAAALTALCFVAVVWDPNPKPSPKSGASTSATIFRTLRVTWLPPGAQWKLSDSWASNLTAIITALAAVTAVFTDKLADVFENRAPVVFALTTAVMLVFAALPPIAYAVLQRQPQQALSTKGDTLAAEHDAPAAEDDSPSSQGTALGWCVAAVLTVFAVEGALAAAMRVMHNVHSSSAHIEIGADIVIVAIGLLVLGYAVHTFALINRTATGQGNVSSLIGIVSVSCCGRDATPTRPRMTLL